MMYLKLGDTLPSVGLIQKLLNHCRDIDPRLSSLEELTVDGVFGRRTQHVVSEAKSALNISPSGGEFERNTWRTLADIAKWRIVDVCDLLLGAYLASKPHRVLAEELVQSARAKLPDASTDMLRRKAEGFLRRWGEDARITQQQFLRFRAQGGEPIPLTSNKRPYDDIRRGLAERSRDGWKVVLLRFTGHGSPGSQGVVGSLYGASELDYDRVLMQAGESDREFIDAIMVGGMAMSMAPFGIIELHGCRVGLKGRPKRGKPMVDGPAFVQTFANVMSRPVSAGLETQYIGNAKLDARFEGRVVTALPGGGTVSEWFARDSMAFPAQ